MLSLGAVAVFAVSCADLDTQPEGEVTGEQFTESVKRDNALLEGVAKSASSILVKNIMSLVFPKVVQMILAILPTACLMVLMREILWE